jgi:hypothetical protein
MALALNVHNSLLRGYLKKHDGYEVKTEGLQFKNLISCSKYLFVGDAFFCSFADSLKAILFCVEVQEALMDTEWPAELLSSTQLNEGNPNSIKPNFRGLRVRMGIHSGVPLCQLDPITQRMDYFGQTVNKSARISSIACGGQIIGNYLIHLYLILNSFKASVTVWEEIKELKELEGIAIPEFLGEFQLRGLSSKVAVIHKIFYFVFSHFC